MGIDEERARAIASHFLGQYHTVIKVDTELDCNQWKLLVHTPIKKIEVFVDVDNGKILGYLTRL